MDDSVKTQQLLISYAMQKGGWKNMPLPSDWIQTTIGNAIIYINCSGCIILDVHPFKYLALGNEREKKLVKAHISEQYDPKKRKANYISCWATCPFPESEWMKLLHVNKNQILYYHTTTNTLTAKHPCRRIVNKARKSLSDSKALPLKPAPLLTQTKDNKLSLDLDSFINNDLQKSKHGKSQTKQKLKRLRSSPLNCSAQTPPPLTYTPQLLKRKTKEKKAKSSKLNTMQLMKPPSNERRTKSSMHYKDIMKNRSIAKKTFKSQHQPKLKLKKVEKQTDTNTSKKAPKHKKKSKTMTKIVSKKSKTKAKRIPSKALLRYKHAIHSPKKGNNKRIKYNHNKVQNVSLSSVSKAHKPKSVPRKRVHHKSKSMKIHLKGKGNKAKNKHKLTFKTKTKPESEIKQKLNLAIVETEDEKKKQDNDLPKWSPISHSDSCGTKKKRRHLKKANAPNTPNTPKKATKEMIKKSNRKTARSKKSMRDKTPKTNMHPYKTLTERLGKRPENEKEESSPINEMKPQFASNLNGFNWNKKSSYARSLSKSVFMYAGSRSNNVLFPVQNKSASPSAGKKARNIPHSVTITPADNINLKGTKSNTRRVRTRMNRSKSNPDSKAADLAIQNAQKHFKVASPNKRRRNAIRHKQIVGISSQLQSQLIAFNETIDDDIIKNEAILEDRETNKNINSKRTVSISLNLSVRPKHQSNPTTPTFLTQSTSREDMAVGEAAAILSDGSISEIDLNDDMKHNTKLEIKSNINESNSDEESMNENIKPRIIQTSAAAAQSYDGFQTANKLVVRDKKTSTEQLSSARLSAHDNNRSNINQKPRSRSHSRAPRKRSLRSRASSLSSTSSRGSLSEDPHYREQVRSPSSSSSGSSDESSISSVSNSSSDSDTDSTISDSSSISSRSSRSSRHSRSSSIHSRSSRSSTPISRNKRLSNTTDKLINAQSSLLGNMANMMQLMSQQQISSPKDVVSNNSIINNESHNKSPSASTGFGFVNINDALQELDANNKATATQFDEFMTNFMTNFNTNGNNINNNVPIFNSFRNLTNNIEELVSAPIMLQNSMADDTSVSASDNDIDIVTPTPV